MYTCVWSECMDVWNLLYMYIHTYIHTLVFSTVLTIFSFALAMMDFVSVPLTSVSVCVCNMYVCTFVCMYVQSEMSTFGGDGIITRWEGPCVCVHAFVRVCTSYKICNCMFCINERSFLSRLSFKFASMHSPCAFEHVSVRACNS
jgi:hypothetical protein